MEPELRQPWAAKPRGVLVTGAGRSGTKFLTFLMRGLGMRVAHDEGMVQVDGAVSWPHAFRVPHCDLPQWSYPVTRPFKEAYLLVRAPLVQIASRSNDGGAMPHQYMNCYSDVKPPDGLRQVDRNLVRALRHYVLQITFVQRYATGTIRIEDIANNPEPILQLCRRHGGPGCTCTRGRFMSTFKSLVSQEVNSNHTASTSNVSWALLAKLDLHYAAMAQQLGRQYGYNYEEGVLLNETSLARRCSWNEAGKWSCELLPDS